MPDGSLQPRTEAAAEPAPAPGRPQVSPALRRAIRLQYLVLAAVVAKFGLLLAGAIWSRLAG